jgi:hypothetical protein
VSLITKRFSFVAAVGLAFLSTLSLSASASNEALTGLLKVLMERGAITAEEYSVLKDAAHADAEKTSAAIPEKVMVVEKKLGALESKTKKSLRKIKWAEKVKIKGDIRTRYQFEDKTGSEERSRGRIRYRLGIIAKPASNWEVGAGLASGGSDPRSTNQTMQDAFSSKGINLDYAYAQYTHSDTGLTAVAGKFKRKVYLWAPTDVMWDGDINPEGVAVSFAPMKGPLWLNAGILVLEEHESATRRDSHMGYGQFGLKFKSGDMFGKLSGTIYTFGQMKAAGSDAYTGAGGTNTDNNLGSFNLAGEVGTKVGGGKFSVVGEYINNYETNTKEGTAYIVGFKHKIGKWKMKYLYADVEHNAVPDFLPDSDRFGGDTGIKGHEVEFEYAINKKVSVGLDYYATEDPVSKEDQDIVQLDLKVEF